MKAIQKGDLVQLDPKQGYSPGGFVSQYSLTYGNNEPFIFFKNVSGVDFGLKNPQAQELHFILNGLYNQAYCPTSEVHCHLPTN